MSAGIDFVLYLGPVGNGPSDQCRRLHSQLLDQARARIKIIDYAEITRALGPKKPEWLRGFPTLSSYESPPRVLEGSAVIATLTEWVQKQQQPQQRQSNQQPQRAPMATGTPAAPATISQSTHGEYNGASVVTDDLYVSQMASKHGGGESVTRGGGSRVSSADIEAYNRARASRQ